MAKTKALISFAVTAKLICAFVFAYADCWFSHAAAHMMKFVKAFRIKGMFTYFHFVLWAVAFILLRYGIFRSFWILAYLISRIWDI